MNFAFQTRYLTNRQEPITCSVIVGTKFSIDFFLTLYSLTSVCIFSLLLFRHFIGLWQGEFSSTIKSFFSWWSFPLFSWPQCLIEGWFCKKKLDVSDSKGLKGLSINNELTSNDVFCSVALGGVTNWVGIKLIFNRIPGLFFRHVTLAVAFWGGKFIFTLCSVALLLLIRLQSIVKV